MTIPVAFSGQGPGPNAQPVTRQAQGVQTVSCSQSYLSQTAGTAIHQELVFSKNPQTANNHQTALGQSRRPLLVHSTSPSHLVHDASQEGPEVCTGRWQMCTALAIIRRADWENRRKGKQDQICDFFRTWNLAVAGEAEPLRGPATVDMFKTISPEQQIVFRELGLNVPSDLGGLPSFFTSAQQVLRRERSNIDNLRYLCGHAKGHYGLNRRLEGIPYAQTAQEHTWQTLAHSYEGLAAQSMRLQSVQEWADGCLEFLRLPLHCRALVQYTTLLFFRSRRQVPH